MQIGFITLGFWDILDILIVAYLLYRLYKLLKGSVAFYILLGLLLLYSLSWLVSVLEMDLLNLLLSQFVNIGVILLIIIFQPEIRKFLLVLGSSAPFNVEKWFGGIFGNRNIVESDSNYINEILSSIIELSESKTGALIVMDMDNIPTNTWNETGVTLNAEFSTPLTLSIFNKNSPLHDGAIVLRDGRILQAGYVLPLTGKKNLPQHLGLRHRAGIGITENTAHVSIIVSEETGQISYAQKGNLHINIDKEQLNQYLNLSFELEKL